MTIRPLHDRVIITREEGHCASPGGIVIPDGAAEKPVRGRMSAIGNGKVPEDGTVRKPDLKTGDQVLFAKHAGTETKVDGDDLLVMRE